MCVRAGSICCHQFQTGCLIFASNLELVKAALAVRWVDRGQRCTELSLAARGSAGVFRSCRFTERTAWLHRWQIVERVEKSEECSPAHSSLLKNVHHASSLSEDPERGRKHVFPACLPFMLDNVLSVEQTLCI